MRRPPSPRGRPGARDRPRRGRGRRATGARRAGDAEAGLPFAAGRGFSAALRDGRLVVKGAPEVVLARCTADEDVRARVQELAADGLRVLAVADREVDGRPDDLEDAAQELDAAWTGRRCPTPCASPPRQRSSSWGPPGCGSSSRPATTPRRRAPSPRRPASRTPTGWSPAPSSPGRPTPSGPDGPGDRRLRPAVARAEGHAGVGAAPGRGHAGDDRRRGQRRPGDPAGRRRHRPRRRRVTRRAHRSRPGAHRPTDPAGRRDRRGPGHVVAGPARGQHPGRRQPRRDRVHRARHRVRRPGAAGHPATAAGQPAHRHVPGAGRGRRRAPGHDRSRRRRVRWPATRSRRCCSPGPSGASPTRCAAWCWCAARRPPRVPPARGRWGGSPAPAAGPARWGSPP